MALCGANLNLDAITSASTDLKDSLKSKLGGAGTFTSNSFQKDQYRLGGEYSYREMFMLRLGYTYEEGIIFDFHQ